MRLRENKCNLSLTFCTFTEFSTALKIIDVWASKAAWIGIGGGGGGGDEQFHTTHGKNNSSYKNNDNKPDPPLRWVADRAVLHCA